MRFQLRFLAAAGLCLCALAFYPLSIGEAGGPEDPERDPPGRIAVMRADAGVRLLGARPDPDADPMLVYVQAHSPLLYRWFVLTSFFAPGIIFFVVSLMVESVVRVFAGSLLAWHRRGRLPPWPVRPDDPRPAICVGEVHYKTRLAEASQPKWMVMPEKGLYAGLIIFGAVGSGKTSSCMRPFCRQLLGWQSHDRDKRMAALVLEVKGDFCFQVQDMLRECDRFDDYLEISLDENGRQWNPLDSPWLDTYSLAYTLASVVTQLFGKSREPFWQQAYTNLMRWIMATYRSMPDPWFTFADVYRCMVDREELEQLIDSHTAFVYGRYRYEVHVAAEDFEAAGDRLASIRITEEDVQASVLLAGQPVATGGGTHGRLTERCLGPRRDRGFQPRTHTFEWRKVGDRYVVETGDAGYGVLAWEMRKPGAVLRFGATCLQEPSEDQIGLNREIGRWYRKEWLALDDKLRTSIVEGISVFLGNFIVPETARIFCPKNPRHMTPAEKERLLPPLDRLVDTGKVLALNMPAGSNPALARAVGVMLKQSWLGTLLLRPKQMAQNPDRYFRPAVFVCDEYHAFATCGEEDPAGDEKAFALTRQSRCIPIVATQSIVSLKAALGEGEAWRALLQTLRSRIFLSLGDDFSAETASKLLGHVNRMRASYSLSENTSRASASMFTGRIGGGGASAGLSKSYAEKREALFHPRDLTLLDTCQAVAQIFDGSHVRDATRIYLKPDFRPRDEPYFRWYEEQQRDGRQTPGVA